jgi:hypothetical protein
MDSSDSSICEKVDAPLIKPVMESKRYLGKGIGNKY